MITSTQEVLVYRPDADEPEAMPWGNLYADHHADRPDWLQAVERRLMAGETWDASDDGGPPGISRIALSRSWRE